jgi:hypothetical protein
VFSILLYDKEMVTKYLDKPVQFILHFLGWPIYLPFIFYKSKRRKKVDEEIAESANIRLLAFLLRKYNRRRMK